MQIDYDLMQDAQVLSDYFGTDLRDTIITTSLDELNDLLGTDKTYEEYFPLVEYLYYRHCSLAIITDHKVAEAYMDDLKLIKEKQNKQ